MLLPDIQYRYPRLVILRNARALQVIGICTGYVAMLCMRTGAGNLGYCILQGTILQETALYKKQNCFCCYSTLTDGQGVFLILSKVSTLPVIHTTRCC